MDRQGLIVTGETFVNGTVRKCVRANIKLEDGEHFNTTMWVADPMLNLLGQDIVTCYEQATEMYGDQDAGNGNE